MVTAIQVSDEVWDKLRKMKTRPSETFDEIIRKLIKNQRKRHKNEKK